MIYYIYVSNAATCFFLLLLDACQSVVACEAVDVLHRVVCVMLDQVLAHVALRVESQREVQGRIAQRILMVDVGIANDEHFHEAFVAVLASQQQQGVAFLVLGVHLEAEIEAIFHTGQPSVKAARPCSSVSLSAQRPQ